MDLDKRYKTVEAENARLRPKMNFRERLAENRELSKEQLELHQLRAVKEQIPKPIWESAAAQAAALSRSISHSHGPSR